MNRKLKLMVGHLLLYHPAFIELKKIVNSGLIGNLRYIYSNRLSLGKLRKEEEMWSGFKSKMRTKIRKSIKNELLIKYSLDNLECFYSEIFIL